MKITIFSDYICPWCYFNTPRVKRLQSELGLSIDWKVFPLHPETPPEGISLQELFAGRGMDIPAVMARLRRAAEEEGLPWGERSMTYNSRRAQELGKWAGQQGAGDAFRKAAFHAYFVDGKNLYLDQVLEGLLQQCGLEVAAGMAALAEGQMAAAVDEDWDQARSMGINAVPSLVAKGRVMSGAYPYKEMVRFVEKAGMVTL